MGYLQGFSIARCYFHQGLPSSLQCFSDLGSGILFCVLDSFIKQLPVWAEPVGGLALAAAGLVSLLGHCVPGLMCGMCMGEKAQLGAREKVPSLMGIGG